MFSCLENVFRYFHAVHRPKEMISDFVNFLPHTVRLTFTKFHTGPVSRTACGFRKITNFWLSSTNLWKPEKSYRFYIILYGLHGQIFENRVLQNVSFEHDVCTCTHFQTITVLGRERPAVIISVYPLTPFPIRFFNCKYLIITGDIIEFCFKSLVWILCCM